MDSTSAETPELPLPKEDASHSAVPAAVEQAAEVVAQGTSLEAIPATSAGETAEPQKSEEVQSTSAPVAAEPPAETERAPEEPEPSEPLAALALRSTRGRLSPAEEEEATTLLIAALNDGREGLARAVEQLPRLPWIIGVNAVTRAWPEMKPAVRNRLLASLGRVDSDGARRVRLSLARGLFKLEPQVAAKIAVGVAKEFRDKETGAITPRNAQVFANVLIGRAKPWIAQLPLAEMKPAEADGLVHSALIAVFTLPHTPVTQLGVLKWAAAAGKLAKLQKAALEAVVKGLNRWSGKWQGVLRREVEGLPEEISSTLKPEQPPEAERQEGERDKNRRGRDKRQRGEVREGEGDVAAIAQEADEATEAGKENEVNEDDEEADTDADADEQADAPEGRQRPVYESKTMPQANRERERESRERDRRPQGSPFNLNETLRQIDHYVAGLRSELNQAQNKLRQRDDEGRRTKKVDRVPGPSIPGEPSLEELSRLNVQLESRIGELQHRILDLTADSEDRAAAMELASGAPVADEDKRLRQLLALKLQESYEDFLALESESPDIVAPKHYRTVLGHVFQVLVGEKIFSSAPAVE